MLLRHIVGRVFASACLVFSMNFPTPVYLSSGVSTVGFGRNFMCLYRCAVWVGLIGLSCGLQEEPVILMYLRRRDLAKALKFWNICACRCVGGRWAVGAKVSPLSSSCTEVM